MRKDVNADIPDSSGGLPPPSLIGDRRYRPLGNSNAEVLRGVYFSLRSETFASTVGMGSGRRGRRIFSTVRWNH